MWGRSFGAGAGGVVPGGSYTFGVVTCTQITFSTNGETLTNGTDGTITSSAGFTGNAFTIAAGGTAPANGFYLDGSSNIIVRRGSASVLTMGTNITVDQHLTSTNGSIRSSSGFESEAGLGFGSDTNTGWWRIGADDMGGTVGGAKIIHFKNDAGTLKTGFFGTAAVAKPAVTGVKSDAVAGNILAALATLGLLTDSTT